MFTSSTGEELNVVQKQQVCAPVSFPELLYGSTLYMLHHLLGEVNGGSVNDGKSPVRTQVAYSLKQMRLSQTHPTVNENRVVQSAGVSGDFKGNLVGKPSCSEERKLLMRFTAAGSSVRSLILPSLSSILKWVRSLKRVRSVFSRCEMKAFIFAPSMTPTLFSTHPRGTGRLKNSVYHKLKAPHQSSSDSGKIYPLSLSGLRAVLPSRMETS